MYQETKIKFEELVNQYNLSKLGNGTDVFVYGSIHNRIIGEIRRNFALSIDEEILWFRDTSLFNNRNQGLVITDWGITYIPTSSRTDDSIVLDWKSIQYVEYSGDCIYFFLGNERENNIPIHISCLFKSMNEFKDSSYADLLAQVFTEISQTQDYGTAEEALERMEEFLENGDYDNAIEETDNVLSLTGDVEICREALFNKAVAYMNKGRNYLRSLMSSKPINGRIEIDDKLHDSYYLKALEALEQSEKTYGSYALLYECKGDIYNTLLSESDEPYSFISRRNYIASLQDDNNERTKVRFEKFRNINNELFSETFKFVDEVKFADRQFILLARNEKQIAGMYDPNDNIKWVFTLNQIPTGIEFEGIPQVNTLYLAHPVKRALYLPFEGAEENLFMDKVREFCYLVQCLGATEIVFHSDKGLRVADSFKSSNSVEVGGDYNSVETCDSVEINGGYSRNRYGRLNQSQRIGVDMVQTFDPIKYPYQPNDLVWLPTDSSWKQLIKQRLEGGMLNYTYKIRSTDISQFYKNQIIDIKASFGHMLVNANANYNANEDTTFSKCEETEWSIQVSFKPLNEFGKHTTDENSLTSDEQEYMEEIKVCLSDNNGTISNSQRRLLDKIRKSFGISENRAMELESMCSIPQLTDDEKEYWEEYKECLNDGGTITSSERRLLERLRKSLGISEERASEIEKF